MDTKQVIAEKAMKKIRAIAKESGLTLQAIGQKMGYHERSARQSVHKFLKSNNPTFDVVVRFCKAMEVKIEKLV